MEIHSGMSRSSGLSIPRRHFIELVAGGTLASVVAGAACGTSPTKTPARTTTFRSRRDLTAPVVNVHSPYGRATGGYVFVTPIGLLILDDRGQPVWLFAWQHDARSHPSNVLTLFDDEGDPPEARQSRALVLTVDEASRTVAVVRQYHHPSNPLLAGGQGSLQVLPNHNLLVGWGAEPSYTECRPDGAVVVDAKFAKGASYRAFRFPWVGVPDDRPALAVDRTRSGNVTGHASWNGATEVASWNLLAGSTAQAPTTLSSAPRNGFEMTIETRTRDRRFSVQAIDDHGKVLGTSLALTV